MNTELDNLVKDCLIAVLKEMDLDLASTVEHLIPILRDNLWRAYNLGLRVGQEREGSLGKMREEMKHSDDHSTL